MTVCSKLSAKIQYKVSLSKQRPIVGPHSSLNALISIYRDAPDQRKLQPSCIRRDALYTAGTAGTVARSG
jgi:hypothetical protein